jgi:hypothetical protein
LASTGIVVSAQNSNSSMTPMTNTAKPKTHKPRKTTMAKTSGRCDPTKQEQTDLSGTYTGKVNHGDGAPQDATLTITGNTFTMTSGSETHSGSITAVTTCGYTAVTVMMGDRTTPPASPNPPPPAQIVSLRAKKVGDKLWLTSVPGETMKVRRQWRDEETAQAQDDHEEDRHRRDAQDHAVTVRRVSPLTR